MHTGIWWGETREIDLLEDLEIDGMILKWIAKKCDWKALIE